MSGVGQGQRARLKKTDPHVHAVGREKEKTAVGFVEQGVNNTAHMQCTHTQRMEEYSTDTRHKRHKTQQVALLTSSPDASPEVATAGIAEGVCPYAGDDVWSPPPPPAPPPGTMAAMVGEVDWFI